MKKWAWLTAVFLLAACGNDGGNDATTETVSSDVPTEITSKTSDVDSEESVSSIESEVVSETTESESEMSGESGGLTLYIPDTLKKDEGTVLYDDVIAVATEFTEVNPDLGEIGLFTLSYTGYYIERDDGSLQAFFMGINRIGEPLKNLSFQLNFVVNDTAIWDNVTFTLDESEFGEHPNHSAMPIFLDVPVGNEQRLMDAVPEETLIEIKNLQINE